MALLRLFKGPPRRRYRWAALGCALLVALLALAHSQPKSAAIDGRASARSAITLTADGSGTTPDPTPGSSPSPGGGSTGSSGSGSGKTKTGSGSGSTSSGSKTGSGSGSGAATGPGKSTAPVQVPPANPNGSADGAGSGSVAWYDIPGQIEQAIDTWFGDLVKSALTPVLDLLGKLVLATPDLTGGRITQIWEVTLGIADSCFVLFVVIGGVIVMTHESVQTRYGLKQILPRLVFGFIAANSSLLAINQILTFGNAVTLAVWDTPLSGAGIGNQLLGYIMASIFTPDGVTQIFMVLFGLVLAVLALAVLFSFALRTAALLLLTILAPPMLLCHALPGLDAAAQLWWRALAAVLAIEFLQATVLMLMLQVFFDPDSNVLGVPTAAGLVDLLVCGALFVILLKIPNWVMRMVLGRAPRSTAMGLLRTAAMAALGAAVGVPGVGSARMLAGRVAGRAAASRLGAIPFGPRSMRSARLMTPRTARVSAPRTRPDFGTAHGRRERDGQGVLFPLPPGSRRARVSEQVPSGRTTSEEAPPTSGPGWYQPPLVPRPAEKPGPLTSGRQLELFDLPEGSRLTRRRARERLDRLQPWRKAWYPEPEPARSPYRQPALFTRKGHLHPDVKATTTRSQAAAGTGPGTQARPSPARNGAPSTPPTKAGAGGATRAPRAAAPPVIPIAATAPRVPSRLPPPAPAPLPRMVSVPVPTAPPARKRGRRSNPRTPEKGGE